MQCQINANQIQVPGILDVVKATVVGDIKITKTNPHLTVTTLNSTKRLSINYNKSTLAYETR